MIRDDCMVLKWRDSLCLEKEKFRDNNVLETAIFREKAMSLVKNSCFKHLLLLLLLFCVLPDLNVILPGLTLVLPGLTLIHYLV